MKKFICIILFVIVFLVIHQTTYAQSSCATISTVTTDTPDIQSEQPFKCTVTVGEGFAGSSTIACGISLDNRFPSDFCPSDEFFGGWQGNTAQFNCVFPYKSISQNTVVKLMAYDFRPECGPSTGKEITLDTSKIIKELNQPSITPQQDITKDQDTARLLLSLLFDFNSRNNQPIPTSPPQTVTVSPINTTIVPTTSFDSSAVLVPRQTPAENVKSMVNKCLAHRQVYNDAANMTGVPWYVLAGIHYREGECGTNKSLVSGRTIGSNEPDIGGNCSSQYTGMGVPKPVPGGCGFDSLLSSAVYAGKHLKSKIGKVPSNFQELAKALSYYNGGGNSNCGKTPYNKCPRKYIGEDDTYVMNFFDSAHIPMYIVYCADHTLCNPAVQDSRPGTATAATALFNIVQ